MDTCQRPGAVDMSMTYVSRAMTLKVKAVTPCRNEAKRNSVMSLVCPSQFSRASKLFSATQLQLKAEVC